MRADISGQVRLYAEHLEALVDDWEIENVLADHGSSPVLRNRKPPNWRRGLLVAGLTAAIVVAAGLAIPFLFRGSETSDPATTPVDLAATSLTSPATVTESAEPTEPFDWVFDLSQWVTEDEMTKALDILSSRYYQDYASGDLGGNAVLARPGGSSGEYVWAVGYWSVGVHAAGGYHPTPDTTDPRLPDGVMYFAARPSYILSGPNSNEAICLTVTTPGTTGSYEEEPNYENMVFEIASMLMEEMGWIE